MGKLKIKIMVEIIDGVEQIVMSLGSEKADARGKLLGIERAEVYQLRTEKRTNGDAKKEAKPEKADGRSDIDKFMASTPKLIFPDASIKKTEKIGKHSLRVTIEGSSIDFTVDDSHNKRDISRKDGVQVGIRALRIIQSEIAKMPDGTFLINVPSTKDGLGDKRARLYEAAGFGKMDGENDIMRAVVKNGKPTPVTSDQYTYLIDNNHLNNG